MAKVDVQTKNLALRALYYNVMSVGDLLTVCDARWTPGLSRAVLLLKAVTRRMMLRELRTFLPQKEALELMAMTAPALSDCTGTCPLCGHEEEGPRAS